MFQARIYRRNDYGRNPYQQRSTPVHRPKPHVPSAQLHREKTPDAPLPNGFSSRIPTTLQQVFLSSNRGNNVDKPPPMKVANRVFRTLWTKTFHKGGREATGTESTTGVSTTEPEVPLEEQTPQEFLDALLLSRGYPITHYKTLNTAYYNKPTPLQQASYSRHIIDLIKAQNVTKFQQIMMCGISPNPCNTFGESSLHMVCRRGDAVLLQVLLADEVGTDLHVADDYGRTPLHDACWASSFAQEVVQLILMQNINENRHMFYMEDARGSLPLSYAQKSQYPQWKQFLEDHKDHFWPTVSNPSSTVSQSLLIHQAPHTRSVADPANALSLELAAMVANGRLEPHEATLIKEQGPATEEEEDETEAETLDDDDSDSDEDSDEEDDDSDYDSEGDEDSEYDDKEMLNEMEAILNKQ
jgi:ankyrin repeat protein